MLLLVDAFFNIFRISVDCLGYIYKSLTVIGSYTEASILPGDSCSKSHRSWEAASMECCCGSGDLTNIYMRKCPTIAKNMHKSIWAIFFAMVRIFALKQQMAIIGTKCCMLHGHGQPWKHILLQQRAVLCKTETPLQNKMEEACPETRFSHGQFPRTHLVERCPRSLQMLLVHPWPLLTKLLKCFGQGYCVEVASPRHCIFVMTGFSVSFRTLGEFTAMAPSSPCTGGWAHHSGHTKKKSLRISLHL